MAVAGIKHTLQATPCRVGKLFDQYVRQTRVQNSFSLAISKRLTFLGSSENDTRTSWQLPLQQFDCHPFATATDGMVCHGGVIATVLSDTTTMHISSSDRRERKAVTTDLNLTFLGVGKVGRMLEIESNLLKVGGLLSVAECKVTDTSSGQVVAVGRHTMMFVGEDGMNTNFSNSLSSVFDV